MKHEVIPDALLETIRNDFITSYAGPLELGRKYNIRGAVIKARARSEDWRSLRKQWHEEHKLPDSIRAEPILTTNINQPVIHDFLRYYYTRYINMLPRLAHDADRISNLLQTENDHQAIANLVGSRDKILERWRVIMGVMAPGQIKDLPKSRKAKTPLPTPTALPLPLPEAPPELPPDPGETLLGNTETP